MHGQRITATADSQIDLFHNLCISLSTDVDTVEEFTDILVPDVACLLNASRCEGHSGDIISAELELILDIGRANSSDSFRDSDTTHSLLSHEVTNFHSLSSDGNVDREVRIHKSHFVQEPHLYTRDHVLNMRANCANACKLLAVSPPKVETKLPLRDNRGDVKAQVLERACQSSAFTRHSDCARFNIDSDALRVLNETG